MSHHKISQYETAEHKFARDFVHCVMKKWRPEWKESSFFHVKADVPVFFTNAMKTKVLPLVEGDRDVCQKNFESYFSCGHIDTQHFKYMAESIVCEYLFFVQPHDFLADRFFSMCLRIARFAALACCFKVENTLHVAADFIYYAIMICKNNNLFQEDTLIQLDSYCAGLGYKRGR